MNKARKTPPPVIDKATPAQAQQLREIRAAAWAVHAVQIAVLVLALWWSYGPQNRGHGCALIGALLVAVLHPFAPRVPKIHGLAEK